MDAETIDVLIEETRGRDSSVRRAALGELCPCHVRDDNDKVWNRLFELAGDSDVGVRRLVFHAMIDGSPRAREQEVVSAIERFRDDESPKLQRQARKALADYRRTGRINLEVT